MGKMQEKAAKAAKRASQGVDTDASAAGEPAEIRGDVLTRAHEVITVALKPIQRQKIKIRIAGDVLLTHAWSKKALEQMLRGQQMTEAEKKLSKRKRDKKDPTEEFNGARYIRNGKDCFPAVAIKKALVDAGYSLGIPKNAVRRGIRIPGDFVEIKHGAKAPTMREDAVRVGPFNKREADLRYRPQYNDWHLDLEVVFRSDLFSAEQVVNLFQHAGWGGIGEWRPERDGDFGTFEVVEAA